MSMRGEGYLFRPTYTDRHGQRVKTLTWWWRLSIKGRRQRPLNTGKTDERSARLWAFEKLIEMRDGDLSCLTADTLTLGKLQKLVADDYVVNGRKTHDHIPLVFGRLKRVLGERTCARDITTVRLKAYVTERLAAGGAPATINLDLAILQRALNLAARDGLVPSRPRGWLPLLRVANARRGFLERPAFEAILARVPETVRGVLVAAYVTGWRLESELLTRQWRHVDLDAGWLRLEPGEGKTGEGRMFPFTSELRAVLVAQRAYTDKVQRELGRVVPWVFQRIGKPITTLQGAWETAREEAGLPGALIHDFRRTAVRNLERAGVPRSAAMKLIGHKTEAIYRRYAIVDEAMLQEGVAKLDTLHEAQRAAPPKVMPFAAPETGGEVEAPAPTSLARCAMRGAGGGL